MSAIDDRLAELSIELPDPPAPLGNYVGAHTVGNLVYLSGHGTNRPDGLISIDTARNDYSVVITDALQLDEAATANCRSSAA